MRLLLVGPVDSAILADIQRCASRVAAGTLLALGPQDTPYRFLAAADAFVLPSYREGLPLSLLEAMAAGLPVIATNVGGVPDVVDAITGILLPPANERALEEAVLWLYGHPEEAVALGQRAARRIAESYEFERVWTSYRAIYVAQVS